MSEQELVENANIENDATGRIILDNIEYYSKKRQINKGDLERAIGVTPGFLSRYDKKDNGQNLSIGVLQAIAKKLEIPLVALLDDAQANINRYSSKLSRFINKLTQETLSSNIEWINECKNGGIRYFDIVGLYSTYFERSEKNYSYNDKYTIRKFTIPETNELGYDILYNDSTIIYSTNSKNKFVNLDNEIRELYETIVFLENKVLVDPNTMNAIDRFLEDDPPF